MAQAGIYDDVIVRINWVSPLDLTTSRCIRAGPSKTINRRLHFAPSSIACSYYTSVDIISIAVRNNNVVVRARGARCTGKHEPQPTIPRSVAPAQWGQKRDNGALKPGCMARIVASVMSLSRGTDCLSLRNVEDIIDLVSRNF
jgi:hypothetical protein